MRISVLGQLASLSAGTRESAGTIGMSKRWMLVRMCESLLDSARHGVVRDAVAVVQCRQGAGVEELVRQRHLPELRCHPGAEQRRRDRLAQTPHNGAGPG